MIEKIKKIFGWGKILRGEKNYSTSPFKDWKIVFLGFCVVNAAIVFYLFMVYMGVSAEKDQNEIVGAEIKFVDEKLLDDVHKIYSEKERELNILMEAAPETADPSI